MNDIIKFIREYTRPIFWPNYSKLNGTIFFAIFLILALRDLNRNDFLFSYSGDVISKAIRLGSQVPIVMVISTIIGSNLGIHILLLFLTGIITVIPLVVVNKDLFKSQFKAKWKGIFFHNLLFVTAIMFISDCLRWIMFGMDFAHMLGTAIGYGVLYILFHIIYRFKKQIS